ncbi:hypothetical protein PtB15_5B79 [Puccinia triticina]|nr:hypothetical protein PtB15_5B79 [Puccinia triticina]
MQHNNRTKIGKYYKNNVRTVAPTQLPDHRHCPLDLCVHQDLCRGQSDGNSPHVQDVGPCRHRALASSAPHPLTSRRSLHPRTSPGCSSQWTSDESGCSDTRADNSPPL